MENHENTIERQIEINAPVAKVWSALTDAEKFGQWFKVELQSAFVVGQTTFGRNQLKGFEMEMQFHIKAITPQSYFAYAWTPFPIDRQFDYSQETPTLVEFFLEPMARGTLVKVKESGFSQVTASRRAEAFRMHSGGWEAQLKNIERFVMG